MPFLVHPSWGYFFGWGIVRGVEIPQQMAGMWELVYGEDEKKDIHAAGVGWGGSVLQWLLGDQ